jgi:hypothetical protein
VGLPIDAFRFNTSAEVTALHAAATATLIDGNNRTITMAGSGEVNISKQALVDNGELWAAINWAMQNVAGATSNRRVTRTIPRYV